jgi:hypothetical protein
MARNRQADGRHENQRFYVTTGQGTSGHMFGGENTQAIGLGLGDANIHHTAAGAWLRPNNMPADETLLTGAGQGQLLPFSRRVQT